MARLPTMMLALAAFAALTACAQEEEVVYIEPEPVAAEPAYTKY